MKLIVSGFGKHPQRTICSYTGSRGVYSPAELSDTIDAPAFVCFGDGYVFASHEGDNSSVFYAYKDGILTSSINQSECSALCHITYNEFNHTLYGSCYGSGNIRTAAFDPVSGNFTGECHNYIQGGRTHSAYVSKNCKTLYSANIAQDVIYVYNISENGALECIKTAPAGNGRGVRHLAFSSDNKIMYAITEYSNEILVYSLPDFYILQVLSTLPEEIRIISEEKRIKSNCSTLCISNDGKRLWGANRFTDTIASFDIKENGLLYPAGHFSCGGHIPRHMDYLPDNTLGVCNQGSDNITFIDADTGIIISSYHFQSPSFIGNY